MHTQSQLAEYLNVSRPALSKEINKMIKEGLVTMEGKRIVILDQITLEKYLIIIYSITIKIIIREVSKTKNHPYYNMYSKDDFINSKLFKNSLSI